MSIQGLYSLSGKTSHGKISRSLEAVRFGFKLFQSLWNLVGTLAALLPRCLSNVRAIRPLQHPILRLRDFMRFGGKMSYRLVNRGPVLWGMAISTKLKTTSSLFFVYLVEEFFLPKLLVYCILHKICSQVWFAFQDGNITILCVLILLIHWYNPWPIH